ncbi:MAG: peptide deformylase [Planctomycetes bacterium]|jgi:peptide deformylase|nr:peptide deformylase [Planctomycetota bacterium]
MAKLLTIITIPDPKLRQKSENLKEDAIKSREFQVLCDDMVKTMLEKDGVGLAAPQVGRPVRLIAVNTKNGPVVLANPKISKKSWLKEWGDEGCLSVPHSFGLVKRHKKITCFYHDRNSRQKTLIAAGLLARVIQHEVDHLDGILFIDKAKDIKKDAP